MTAPAHVLVFRPLIALLEGARSRDRGDRTGVRADRRPPRAARNRGDADRPARRPLADGKAARADARLPALRRWAGKRRFDVALAHGSHELTLAARRLGIPSSTTFDYEFATVQHQLGCRAATKVVVPEAIPPERLAPYGVRPPKLVRYPGLKEEYYLADFEPDPGALDELLVDRSKVLVVIRTPPDVSLYHRRSNPLFPQVLEHIGRDDRARAIVVPRTREQRDYVRALALPSLIVPERAVDAQSLIAFADLVVSAGAR